MRLGASPTTLGALNREMLLLLWEMLSVAIGHSEETIQSLRQVDELVLSERDVGLYSAVRVVWASKGWGKILRAEA